MILLPSDPIEVVIARTSGPPRPRHGDRTRRLWWACPFHDDRNPSLCVVPGKERYHCFGCGAGGDAIDFVRRRNPGMSFPEAVRAIGGGSLPGPCRAVEARTPRPAAPRKADRPEGWQAFAREIVSRAEALLWSDQGAEAQSYLRGERGLSEETIREARLGSWPEDDSVGGIWVPRGLVIPWFAGPAVAGQPLAQSADVRLINVRRPEGQPKYLAVKGSHRGGIYPGWSGIVRGKPLVIAEGEFDALLLGQELRGLCSVVTLGSASDRPNPRILNALLKASPWIIAGDADDAGKRSAANWLSRSDRCVRVAPPQERGKDWTAACQNGLDLRVWWQETLARQARLGVPGSPPPPASPLEVVKERLVPDPPSGLPVFLPPSGTNPGDASWQAELESWSEELQEAWDERSGALEFDGALDRATAERRAFEIIAGRHALDPWEDERRTALWRAGFPEVAPTELDALVPAIDEVGVAQPWTCQDPFCLHQGRWWLSAHDVG